MCKELILITGGFGHIGFRTLVIAFESGHRVRLALHSENRFEAIRSALALHYSQLAASLALDQLPYIIVPDMTIPGAYDAAVDGVSGVIHIASSITGGKLTEKEYHDYFILPATRGTIGMLKSASKSPTVNASSSPLLLSLSSPSRSLPSLEAETESSIPRARAPLDDGPYVSELQVYAAPKAAIYDSTLAWLDQVRPNFEVVHFAPTYVMGRDDL